jgi:hypothetical protein
MPTHVASVVHLYTSGQGERNDCVLHFQSPSSRSGIPITVPRTCDAGNTQRPGSGRTLNRAFCLG